MAPPAVPVGDAPRPGVNGSANSRPKADAANFSVGFDAFKLCSSKPTNSRAHASGQQSWPSDSAVPVAPADVPPTLWGIHGRLYDLTKFYERHPGGRYFLERSRGLDISVMYEACHAPKTDAKRRHMLEEFAVGEAATVDMTRDPTSADWRHLQDEHSFFQRIRRRVWEECSPTDYQRLYDAAVTSLLFVFIASLAALAVNAHAWTWGRMTLGALVCAVSRVVLFGAGHMYIHSGRRQFGDVLVDLMLTSSFRWKRTHIFVHHPFTNQGRDVDHTSLGRLRRWPLFRRYFYVALENLWKRFVEGFSSVLAADSRPPLRYMVARLELVGEVALFAWCGALPWLLVTWTFANALYQSMLLAGHYTDVCQLNGRHFDDWAVHQILVTNDFKITGVPFVDCLASASLSVHTAHHLFPTFNAMALVRVDEIIWEMCRDEGIPRREIPYLWRLWPEMRANLFSPDSTDKSQ